MTAIRNIFFDKAIHTLRQLTIRGEDENFSSNICLNNYNTRNFNILDVSKHVVCNTYKYCMMYEKFSQSLINFINFRL